MFFRFEIIRIRIIKVMLLQWEINCKSASEGIYEKREYFFYKKLDEIEKQMEKYNCKFIRIHKSYLVNGRQILQYHPKFVMMRNKERLPISSEKRNAVVQYHMELLEKM